MIHELTTLPPLHVAKPSPPFPLPAFDPAMAGKGTHRHDHLCTTNLCAQVFELLLGTNELLTSFDAINVLAPHNEAPPPGWLHVDQTPLRPHFACLQGLVNLVDVSAETSGGLLLHPTRASAGN